MIIRTTKREQLLDYTKQWIKGEISHLYVMGFPGSSKTHTLRELTEELGDKVAWCTGHASPMAFYIKLFDLVDDGYKLIIIDDIDGFLKHTEMTSLLKQATDDKAKRILQWTTNIRTLPVDPELELPKDVRFCILTNNVHGYFDANVHVQALYDRCHTILHMPEAVDVVNDCTQKKIITSQLGNAILAFEMPDGLLSYRLIHEIADAEKEGKDWRKDYQHHVMQAKKYALAATRKLRHVR